MATYGPFTAVAATVQQCQIGPDAGAIYVNNTSRFDLQVSLTWGRPDSSNNFFGLPATYTVNRGDRRGIPIPRDNYGANGFPGWVWVLPVDNSGQLALTGTASPGGLFTIMTYADASQLPPDYASPQAVDAASQQRVIAVPIPAVSIVSQTGALSVGTIVNLSNIAVSSAITANQQGNFYVHAVMFSLSAQAGGWSGVDVALELVSLTSGGAVVDGPFTLYRALLYIGGSADKPTSPGHVFCPALPMVTVFSFTPGSGAFQLSVQLHALNIAGANPIVSAVVLYSLDRNNQDRIGVIGQPFNFPAGPNNPRIF